MIIRKEEIKDKEEIYNLVKEAFKNAEHSDGQEHNLVNKLRNSESFIPELALVAEDNEKIAAHIMYTKVHIVNGEEKYESLALAPLSVLPEYQNKGVGSHLVNTSLNIARALGYESVIVLGSEKYYPRFGFEEAAKYKITATFDVPSENFMVLELKKNALKGMCGMVSYCKEFFE